MEKTAYILNYFGSCVAVIIASDEHELTAKLKKAIQEEVGADEDGQYSALLDRIGDYGETTKIQAEYVQDGCLVDDGEFDLVKIVLY